nr:MAG TPA: hypothetical protein [Caudoviricetes sp.]
MIFWNCTFGQLSYYLVMSNIRLFCLKLLSKVAN